MPNAVPKIAECGIFLEVLPHISLLRRRLPGIFNASLSNLKKYAEWRSEICRMTNLPSLPWLAPSLPGTKDNRSFSIWFETPFECFIIQNVPRKLTSVGFDDICYSPKSGTAIGFTPLSPKRSRATPFGTVSRLICLKTERTYERSKNCSGMPISPQP